MGVASVSGREPLGKNLSNCKSVQGEKFLT